MRLWSDSFVDHGAIPSRCAFCRIDLGDHVALAENRSPHFGWADLPPGTQSLALLCVDPDAPSEGDRVNRVGEVVPISLPRVEFFHWALIDLSPGHHGIAEGQFSNGVTPRGKHGPAGPEGCRQGLNDYTTWFAADPAMQGEYFGYDGPCPPWNDALPHRYVFTLYALDVPRLSLEGIFTGPQARDAIGAHAIARASLTGRYTLNSDIAL